MFPLPIEPFVYDPELAQGETFSQDLEMEFGRPTQSPTRTRTVKSPAAPPAPAHPPVAVPNPFPSSVMTLSLADNAFLGINANLSHVMSALAANPTTKDMCIAVVDLQAPPAGTEGVYQGLHDDDMLYVGSLQKISAMYAAFELRARVRQYVKAAVAGGLSISTVDWRKMQLELKKAWQPKLNAAFPGYPPGFPDLNSIFTLSAPDKVNFSSSGHTLAQLDTIGTGGSLAGLKFLEWLKLMVRWSNNHAAANCILALSYPYINGVLMNAGFFDPATTMTLPLAGRRTSPPRGLWISGNYANISRDWRVDRTADDANAGQPKTPRWATRRRPKTNFGATARKVAYLFALIAKDRLVDPGASQEMRDLLSSAELNARLPANQALSYAAAALTGGGRTFEAVFSKIGIGDDGYIHDAGIVQRSVAGHKVRYVVVVLGSVNNLNVLYPVFVDIDKAL